MAVFNEKLCYFSHYCSKNKNLNAIYFTSITQKAHGTYSCILESADVGICGLMWWRKPENPSNSTFSFLLLIFPFLHSTGDNPQS